MRHGLAVRQRLELLGFVVNDHDEAVHDALDRLERVQTRHPCDVVHQAVPFWMHDSTCCRYLESCEIGPDRYDAYYCLQGGNMPTVLLRHGNEGGDYLSSALDMALVPEDKVQVFGTFEQRTQWRLRRAWVLDMQARYDLKSRFER